MKYVHLNARTALVAVLVFSFSVTRSQSILNDTSVEMSTFMKLDTILFLENHIFQDVPHSLCIGSTRSEMLVFNHFPLSKIDSFDLVFVNKKDYTIHSVKVPIPANEYLHLKRFNHCSGMTFNDTTIILGFYNKFIVLDRNKTGEVNFSHSFGHILGYFNDLQLSQDTLLAAKCAYSSSSKTTLLCSFVASSGIMTGADSWVHPYIEFAHFDMNKKWVCFSDRQLIVSNAFDDTIQVLQPNREIARFSLDLEFDNPPYALDSLRGMISENEPRKWIDALSAAYYFKSSIVTFIQVIDSHYLLIRYVRPGETYNNRTFYACARLKQDFTGIEEYVFKEIPELRVPKNVNQFISKENFDFFSTSTLLDIHNRDAVLVKADGKTKKYDDTRANIFLLNQSYLKKYDPIISLYFYHFSFN